MLIDVNLGKNSEYCLTYELFDNRVATRIWKRFKEQDHPVISPDRFYGFGETKAEVEQTLNECVNQLKELRPDLIIESMDLNHLHDLFASTHYELQKEKYPSQKLNDLLVKLNYTIHHLEDITRTAKKRFITCTNDPGEPLQDSDYELFTPDMRKNWLYMNYPHVGKHIMAIFNDGDIDIPQDQIQPTSILKNDLAGWLDDDVIAGKRYLLNLNRFLAKIHHKLPYTIGDKRLAVGKIPLGKLIHEPEVSEIKKYRFIHSIKAY